MKTAKERMIRGEELYEELVKDNEKLEDMLEFLKQMHPKILPISDYYFNQ